MRPATLVSFLATITACFAAPTAEGSTYQLHEKRDGAPHSWTKRSRAEHAELLPVRIGLTQRNLHRAEEFVLDIADPTSPNFGKHSILKNLHWLMFVQVNTGRRRRLRTLLHHWSPPQMRSSHGFLISASILAD